MSMSNDKTNFFRDSKYEKTAFGFTSFSGFSVKWQNKLFSWNRSVEKLFLISRVFMNFLSNVKTTAYFCRTFWIFFYLLKPQENHQWLISSWTDLWEMVERMNSWSSIRVPRQPWPFLYFRFKNQRKVIFGFFFQCLLCRLLWNKIFASWFQKKI